jgi:hypothetical protein
MSTIEAIMAMVSVIVYSYVLYTLGQIRGRAEGFEFARGWRDKAIADLLMLAEEAIKQRDEARATRIVLVPKHSLQDSKEWN